MIHRSVVLRAMKAEGLVVYITKSFIPITGFNFVPCGIGTKICMFSIDTGTPIFCSDIESTIIIMKTYTYTATVTIA
jgi:hypothetical protein